MPSLSFSTRVPAAYWSSTRQAGTGLRNQIMKKGKIGREHFSHLPLDQPVGFGCGFCLRSCLGVRSGLHPISHGNPEKTGYRRRLHHLRFKSCRVYLLQKRIVDALAISGAGSGATGGDPDWAQAVFDRLSTNDHRATQQRCLRAGSPCSIAQTGYQAWTGAWPDHCVFVGRSWMYLPGSPVWLL